MAVSTEEIVIVPNGDPSRKDLVIVLEDEFGAVINLSGGSVRLVGESYDLPDVDLDLAGVVFDGPQGVCKWAGIGSESVISVSEMGGKARASYRCRVKFTDASGKKDYGPEFQLDWLLPPLS